MRRSLLVVVKVLFEEIERMSDGEDIVVMIVVAGALADIG